VRQSMATQVGMSLDVVGLAFDDCMLCELIFQPGRGASISRPASPNLASEDNGPGPLPAGDPCWFPWFGSEE
jgi:hypothetical protein